MDDLLVTHDHPSDLLLDGGVALLELFRTALHGFGKTHRSVPLSCQFRISTFGGSILELHPCFPLSFQAFLFAWSNREV